MPYKLIIDMFSGRPNPSLVLRYAELRILFNKISIGSIKKRTENSELFPSMMDYRGMILERNGRRISADLQERIQFTPGYAYMHDTIVETDSLPVIESFALDRLDSFQGTRGIKSLKRKLSKRIDEFHEKCQKWRKNYRKWYPGLLKDWYPKIPSRLCFCAPRPDLDAWNTDPNIQWNNNCYNYGTNYRTDTYAQPGFASGQEENDLSACSVPLGHISATMGAEADGLIALPSNNNTCPKVGHLVALVISPNSDYHWYRKGRNGKWSHKMGGSPATILDNSGNPITDPRTADRGSYVDFCTFMQVIHGHFKIDGPY
jgi:hypothetical protein